MNQGAMMRGVLAVSMLGALGCVGEARREPDPAVRALQVELLERVSRDQAIRDSAFLPGAALDSTMAARMASVDRDNTTWLKAQVSQHGWPSRDKVGERASQAAFLIVQHATHDPAFQAMMLDTLTAAWSRGEVDGESYALLYDRVQSQAGRKQRYGTQARLENGVLAFDPMEDSSRVDSLRQTVGLPSLAEYRRVLDSVYRNPVPRK